MVYNMCVCVLVRYRKVATDKCVGGPLVDKYRAQLVNCPVIKPAGLSIEVAGGDVVPVYRQVNFTLTQEQVYMAILFYFILFRAAKIND